MTISMYDMSVPVFKKNLANLTVLLNKAKAFCEAKEIEESALLDDRLFADMFTFARQIQMATDLAHKSIAYLLGGEPETHEDNEFSIDQLLARITLTQGYLNQVSAEQVNASESNPLDFNVSIYNMAFTSGYAYLQNFALPNFYFHVTTAYNILRHNGIEIGKGDFLGDTGAAVTMIDG